MTRYRWLIAKCRTVCIACTRIFRVFPIISNSKQTASPKRNVVVVSCSSPDPHASSCTSKEVECSKRIPHQFQQPLTLLPLGFSQCLEPIP